MATVRCTACGKTDTVSEMQKRLLQAGIKVVHHGPNKICSGGKFK